MDLTQKYPDNLYILIGQVLSADTKRTKKTINIIGLTKQLTETEFKNTFGNKMTDVSETAEPVVDIWDYVEELVKEKVIDNYVYENNLVETVYRNDSSTFDHILLPTDDRNVFITLVVDLTNSAIFGHIKLDLNEKYGLTK